MALGVSWGGGWWCHPRGDPPGGVAGGGGGVSLAAGCPHGAADPPRPTVSPQLGPWLAVEIPDLVAKGIVQHKEK